MSPIKPENRHLYPPRKEWLAIRAEVLARDGNACKECGVPNYAEGFRDSAGNWHDAPGHAADAAALDGERLVRIVLTIAHLDHDPRNNGEPGNRPNLAALCQLHHFAHDLHHHIKNGRRTRAAKLGLLDMLEDA